MRNYRAMFAHHVESDLLDDIRSSSNKGIAIDHDYFKDEIEVLTQIFEGTCFLIPL